LKQVRKKGHGALVLRRGRQESRDRLRGHSFALRELLLS
jgi:hypothetical protein